MALIRCRECRNRISDQASACPKCGAPVAPAEPTLVGCPGCGNEVPMGTVTCPYCDFGVGADRSQRSLAGGRLLLFLVMCIVGVAAWGWLLSQRGGDSTGTRTGGMA